MLYEVITQDSSTVITTTDLHLVRSIGDALFHVITSYSIHYTKLYEACRTNRQSAVPYLARFNAWIWSGVTVEVLFIFAIIYLPIFHHFFTTSPLQVDIWLVMLIAPLVIFVIEELRKYLVRKGVNILSA